MTKLDDKCDAFGFHIVNFPFMSINIPSAPAYGVCINKTNNPILNLTNNT